MDQSDPQVMGDRVSVGYNNRSSVAVNFVLTSINNALNTNGGIEKSLKQPSR